MFRVEIPVWMLAAPFGLAAAWLFLRSRRFAPHMCACGYDLRGVADTAPCPECGRTRVISSDRS